jgi:hypothetical protein
MPQRIKLSAFFVASQLDIKGIKAFLDIKPLSDSSSDLFYSFSGGKHQYYTNYGVIAFAGYGEDEMKWAIKAWLRDDHDLCRRKVRPLPLTLTKWCSTNWTRR